MRYTVALAAALVGLGAHCAHCPDRPSLTPESQVYFDSGAVVRVHLRDETEVTGTLLTSFAPGGWAMTLCEERQGSCGSLDGAAVRTVPMNAIKRLRYRSHGGGDGANGGLWVGMLVGMYTDSVGPLFLLTGLAGGVVGWVLGSAVTTWPAVATREGSGRLLWTPGTKMIPEPPARHAFVTSCARGDSLPRADLVAVVRWTQRPFHTEVRRAWRVDSTERRLVPVSTDGIRCRNRFWLVYVPKDTLRAPAESVGVALRFTVSPGKARLYLYHVPTFIMEPFIVTLDQTVLGPLRYDRYMTIEVDPGPHRLGALHLSDSTSFDTEADRVYFIKLMPGSWKLTGTRFTAEFLDEAEGRKAILAAELMPPP